MEIEDFENIIFKIANTVEEFDDGRRLFSQYAKSLDLDLSFQDFDIELATIDQQYNFPDGALLLAYKKGIAIGCTGIRKFNATTAELKRMFVAEEYRKYKIGKTLLEKAIHIARELYYDFIRLDTLPDMTAAQNLYRSFGFYEISAYRFNPVAETIFMEKKLELLLTG